MQLDTLLSYMRSWWISKLYDLLFNDQVYFSISDLFVNVSQDSKFFHA